MSFTEMWLAAASSLRASPLRTFLTMLGIWIGVASIIIIVAMGQGGQKAVISTIASTRLQNTIQILPQEIVEPGLPQPGQVLSFQTSDLQLAQQFSGVASVSYSLYGQATVGYHSHTLNASVQAGPAYLNDLAHFTVISGHMFTSTDVLAHRQVALVSQSLAGQLFGHESPIGRVILVGGYPLQVIGETISSQFDLMSRFLGSNYLYLPSTTCRDLFPWWGISEMDVQVSPGASVGQVSQRLVTALNIHAHNAQAFADASGLWLGLEQTVRKVSTILTLTIGSVAGIALLVGGIGVMNIMLVSVTERTQEIGIRMSLGATRRAVLLQFLTEAVMITTGGGLLGVVLGVGASAAIRWFTGFPASVSWQAAGVGFLFSMVIGVACGLYPANKAARLNPIDALRYE